MKHGLKYLCRGALLASTLTLLSDGSVMATNLAPVAISAPAAITAPAPAAPAGDFVCSFCGRYEGHAVHPVTQQWEPVVYAYCEWWEIAGGGVDCEEPLNSWNEENEWEGDVCSLTPYTEWGDEECDCTYEPLMPFPYDPLQIDDCIQETPAQTIAADGFIVSARTIDIDSETDVPLSQTTCTGIVSGIALAAADERRLRVASRLTI